MNQSDLIYFIDSFFGKCQEILKAKTADYTGERGDALANFKSVEMLGIPTEVGFLTRMMDKMMRISSFVEHKNLKVKDESVIDTLQDLANYAALLAAYIDSMGVNGIDEQEVVNGQP